MIDIETTTALLIAYAFICYLTKCYKNHYHGIGLLTSDYFNACAIVLILYCIFLSVQEII